MLRNIFKVILTLLFGTIPFFNCSRYLKKGEPEIAFLSCSDSKQSQGITYYKNQTFTTYRRISSFGNWMRNKGTLDSTSFGELQKYWAECQNYPVKDYYKPENPLSDEVRQELTIYNRQEKNTIYFYENDTTLPLCIREIIRISTSPTITANLVNPPPLLTYSYSGNNHEITYNNDHTFTAYSRTSSRGKEKWISNNGTLDSATYGKLQKYLAECQGDSVKVYYRPENPRFDDTWQELNIYNGQNRKVITFCERDNNLPFCIKEIIRISTSPMITTSLVNYPSPSTNIVLSYSYSNQFRGASHGITYYDNRTFYTDYSTLSRSKWKSSPNGGILDSSTFGELQKYWAECQSDSVKTSYENPEVLDAASETLTIYYGLEQKVINFYSGNENLPTCIREILRINQSPK